MPITTRAALAMGVALALAVAACSGDDDSASGAAASGGEGSGAATSATTAAAATKTPYPADYKSDVYSDDANWLCKPGRDDVCSRDLDATVVKADGSTEVERHHAADDPPIDCFYVYPTTSGDPGPNSDFKPQEAQEIATAYNQVARLNQDCRVFAPIYRQITVSMIGGGARGGGQSGRNPGEIAYGDVLDAFKYFIVHESHGRPFVLIGHSQGSSQLSQLMQQEIDDQPLLRDRLVSALLLGWPVGVPPGKAVGGDFKHIPLCEAADQTGCIVAYSSFRSTSPPPAGSLFGRARGGAGLQAACVNPAALGGGSATLHPYFAVHQPDGTLLGGASAQPFADKARTAEIKTPFVTYPDFVDAECVHEGDFTYLKLTVKGDPSDPRTDDIGGDLTPEWGMHLVDANVAMGDLVDLVKTQSEAFQKSSGD
jgi:hypothetical protein